MDNTRRHTFANGLAAVLCVLLVLFPKGGVRVGSVPVTWGYLLLFAAFLGLLPYRMLAVKARYVRRQVVTFLCLIPFALVFAYTYLAYGATNNGGLISTGVSLLFFPLLFLWFFPPMLNLIDGRRLMKLMSFCILAAAIFGIVLFVFRPLTGHWIQIPYLTVNADDAGDFANTKNISRGAVYKLISTYNNGNLYGAATFILLRLFDEFTPKRWKRWTVRLALFLTLSRTVWAGLIFDQALSFAALLFQQRDRFPRVQLGRIAKGALALLIAIPFVLGMLTLINFGDRNNFLLDPTLGGRTSQFTQLGSNSFLPSAPSTFFFAEIIYLSAVNLFGGIGFFVISFVLLSPCLVVLLDQAALEDPVRRAAFKGLLLYALICTSDGALNLIPVMAFYWFAYMIFLFGLPGVGQYRTISALRSPAPAFPQSQIQTAHGA